MVMKHQQVVAFSNYVEDVYTYIALMILLSDTLITCCLGYIIVTVSNMTRRNYTEYLIDTDILHIR